MERRHPDAFAALAEKIEAMREALPVAPTPSMSDQGWRAIFDEQIAREGALLHAVMAPFFGKFG